MHWIISTFTSLAVTDNDAGLTNVRVCIVLRGLFLLGYGRQYMVHLHFISSTLLHVLVYVAPQISYDVFNN